MNNSIKTLYILTFLILSSIANIQAQQISPEKIYFLFVKNDGRYDKALGKIFPNQNGLNINLYQNYFIHTREHFKDTILLNQFQHLTLIRENELKDKESDWWQRNVPFLKEQYKDIGIIPPFDRNGIFDPYVIQQISDEKFIIYQVDFRNEGVKD